MEEDIERITESQDYDPQRSLLVIHGLVHTLCSWRNQLSADIHEPLSVVRTDRDVEEHIYNIYEFTFRQVACSQASVGALAPFFEGLFSREFACLRSFYNRHKPGKKNSHHRWSL